MGPRAQASFAKRSDGPQDVAAGVVVCLLCWNHLPPERSAAWHWAGLSWQSRPRPTEGLRRPFLATWVLETLTIQALLASAHCPDLGLSSHLPVVQFSCPTPLAPDQKQLGKWIQGSCVYVCARDTAARLPPRQAAVCTQTRHPPRRVWCGPRRLVTGSAQMIRRPASLCPGIASVDPFFTPKRIPGQEAPLKSLSLLQTPPVEKRGGQK